MFWRPSRSLTFTDVAILYKQKSSTYLNSQLIDRSKANLLRSQRKTSLTKMKSLLVSHLFSFPFFFSIRFSYLKFKNNWNLKCWRLREDCNLRHSVPHRNVRGDGRRCVGGQADRYFNSERERSSHGGRGSNSCRDQTLVAWTQIRLGLEKTRRTWRWTLGRQTRSLVVEMALNYLPRHQISFWYCIHDFVSRVSV